MRRPRIAVLGAALMALLLLLSACGSGEDDGDDGNTGGESKGSITVGSDAFPEAQILGEMYALLLEDAGYTVERQLNLDSREVRLDAMAGGEVDVAPEYLASLLSVMDPEADLSGDAAAVAGLLEPVLAEKDLQLLDFSDAIDTNAFVVTQGTADQYGMVTMSDLGEVAGDLVLGAPAECPERPFCLPGLDETYGAVFADFKPLEYGAATAQALSAGAIDVALLFSTDALIEANDFVLLDDDKGLQSADNIVPLAVSDVAGDVGDILNPLSEVLTTDDMTALNARVAIDAEDPADVAREYLEEKGLL